MKFRAIYMMAVALAILFSSSLQAQTGPVLRWKLEKGQKFKVVSTNDTKAEIDTPMGVQKMPSKMTTTVSWEVVESKDGNFKMKQVVDRIQVNMVVPFLGTELEYDSDDKDAEVQGMAAEIVKGIKAMVGKESTVQFNERGIVKKDTEKQDDGNDNQMAMMMGDDMASQMFFELPEKAVAKGDSWEQTIKTDMPGGSVTMKNKYTYDGKVDTSMKSLHKIKIAGDLEMDVDQNGVTIELDEGSITGTLTFDATGGHLTKAEMVQKMVMEIDAGVQTMTNTANATIKVTITKEEEEEEE